MLSDLSQALRSTSRLLSQFENRGPTLPRLRLRTQIVIVASCFAAALAIRSIVGIWVPGVVPYATFFPAIALAALLGGFWPGVVTWLLSVFAGLLFVTVEPFSQLTLAQATSASLFAFAAGVQLLIASAFRDLLWRVWRSEARYRAVVVDAANFLSVFDSNGACIEPQPSWELLTGMQWPGYQGLAWLDAVHEEDRGKLRALGTALDGGSVTLEVRIWDKPLANWRWFRVRAAPLRSVDGDAVIEWIGALTDISERKAAQERRELLLEDMRHRAKNFLAIIHGLVKASLPKNDAGAAAFADTFLARVRALEAAGDLVMKANAHDVDLADVVPAAISPFLAAYGPRITVDGASLLLAEATVGGIALACNELVTNAIKYGALSNDRGKVTIRWRINGIAGGERVLFEFLESGGPPVRPPTREGFGSRIIRAAGRSERDHSVTLDYKPEGFECRLEFTLQPAASN